VSQVRPTYTVEALERRVMGSVTLDLVVARDGLPIDIRVVGSLDDGLDAEAIKAVRQWRFAPGRLDGQPVDVAITVVLDFRIH
jgi:protein TonB